MKQDRRGAGSDGAKGEAVSKHMVAVEIEKRAAELEESRLRGREADGWDAHRGFAFPYAQSSSYWSGWLAREIATHDERATRDANSWLWDPSRPVAGQYEEWVADGHPGCAACGTVGGCEVHELFTCAACMQLAAENDRYPGNICAHCWAAKEREAEQQRRRDERDAVLERNIAWVEFRRDTIDDARAQLAARGVTDPQVAADEVRAALDKIPALVAVDVAIGPDEVGPDEEHAP